MEVSNKLLRLTQWGLIYNIVVSVGANYILSHDLCVIVRGAVLCVFIQNKLRPAVITVLLEQQALKMLLFTAV